MFKRLSVKNKYFYSMWTGDKININIIGHCYCPMETKEINTICI